MTGEGAGGDPSPAPLGLENGKVLMGDSEVTWLSAPTENEVTVSFLLKISPGTAEGWRWRCPGCPDSRVPVGGQGLCAPPGPSPHTGRAAAAWGGPGGRQGHGCCSPTLLLAASGPAGRKRELGAPKAHCAVGSFFHAGCDLFSQSDAHLPGLPVGFGCSEAWGLHLPLRAGGAP